MTIDFEDLAGRMGYRTPPTAPQTRPAAPAAPTSKFHEKRHPLDLAADYAKAMEATKPPPKAGRK